MEQDVAKTLVLLPQSLSVEESFGQTVAPLPFLQAFDRVSQPSQPVRIQHTGQEQSAIGSVGVPLRVADGVVVSTHDLNPHAAISRHDTLSVDG